MLNTRILIAEDEEDINPHGLRVVIHRRDRMLVCLNGSGEVLGTCAVSNTFRATLSGDLVSGQEHVEHLLHEGWERDRRGLFAYAVTDNDVTVPFAPDLDDLEVEVIGDDSEE